MIANSETERKLIKIINDNQLPIEIINIIKNIYLDYEEACNNCIIKVEGVQDDKNQNEINLLQKHLKSLCKDDISTIDTIIKSTYEEKKTRQIEGVINENRETKARKEKQLELVLFDSQSEEAYYQDHKEQIQLEEIIKNRKNNVEFVETIRQVILSEMRSSQKDIVMEIGNSNIFEKDDIRRMYKKHIQDSFMENMDVIIKKVEKEIPETGKILESQDEETYKNIIQTIIEQNEVEKPEEQSQRNERAEFVSSIHAEVKTEEAIKKVEENKNNDKNKEQLPDIVIE